MDRYELTRRRKELKIRQQDLADTLGMTQTTVARWERGAGPIPKWLDLALNWIEHEYKPTPAETLKPVITQVTSNDPPEDLTPIPGLNVIYEED